jgi:transcriptional regulator with XRE-family HTH domain
LDILTIDCIGMVERIKSIINYYKLTDRAFAIKCNIKQNTLSRQLGGTSEVSLSTIDAILSTFEDISSEWLLRGKGTMLLSDVEHERNIIPDSNMERMNRLVDTIATLQGALNEKDKTIKLLEEKVKRLETELAMIKNERKIG